MQSNSFQTIIGFSWNQGPKLPEYMLNQLPLLLQIPILEIRYEKPMEMPIIHKTMKQTNQLVLQLRGKYLVIYNIKSHQILDFTMCKSEIQFQIGPNAPSSLHGKKKNQDVFGKYLWLKLSHQQKEFASMTLIFDRKFKIDLELLRIELQKKSILQKGFHQQFKPFQKLDFKKQDGFAVLYRAIRIRDNTHVIVKAFKKSVYFKLADGKGKASFFKQLEILSLCSHQNICSFKGVFSSQNTYYIVLEPLQNLRSNHIPNTSTIVNLIHNLLQALSHLHSNGIMHRDIKPDNIMLRKVGTEHKAVLIDMGLAEFVGQPEYLFHKCGTHGYVAPQTYLENYKYDQKCDIFSLGAVFYYLLFDKSVFNTESFQKLVQSNQKGALSIDLQSISQLHPAISNLLFAMLQTSPEKRISAYEALNHPLFNPQSPTFTDITATIDNIGSTDLIIAPVILFFFSLIKSNRLQLF